MRERRRPRTAQSRALDEERWRGIDRLLERDPECRALARASARLQRRLLRILTPQARTLYVDLEDVETRKRLRQIEVVACWTYSRGARKRRRE